MLYDVLDVVRLERLLELAPSHEELDLAQCSDGVLMSRRQLRQYVRLFQIVFIANVILVR